MCTTRTIKHGTAWIKKKKSCCGPNRGRWGWSQIAKDAHAIVRQHDLWGDRRWHDSWGDRQWHTLWERADVLKATLDGKAVQTIIATSTIHKCVTKSVAKQLGLWLKKNISCIEGVNSKARSITVIVKSVEDAISLMKRHRWPHNGAAWWIHRNPWNRLLVISISSTNVVFVSAQLNR